MEKGITVLSLFDGMCCGRLALEKAGIPVKRYYASEIKKVAIQNTKRNYPDVIQLGNVEDIHYEDGWLYYKNPVEGEKEKRYIGKIDLLIGGSPCQDFSSVSYMTHKEEYGLKGSKSKLFYEYLRIKEEVNPKYFLLENVRMKKSSEEELNNYLGVQGIHINSNLVSIQNRYRIYWTNIPNVEQPEDCHLNFQDYKTRTLPKYERELQQKKLSGDNTALEVEPEDVPVICKMNEKLRETEEQAGVAYSDKEFVDFVHELLRDAIANKSKSWIKAWNNGKGRSKEFSCKNITNETKINCLLRSQYGFPNSGLIEFGDFCRMVTKSEIAFAQNVPYDFVRELSFNQTQDLCGDGWTIDVISYILGKMVY